MVALGLAVLPRAFLLDLEVDLFAEHRHLARRLDADPYLLPMIAKTETSISSPIMMLWLDFRVRTSICASLPVEFAGGPSKRTSGRNQQDRPPWLSVSFGDPVPILLTHLLKSARFGEGHGHLSEIWLLVLPPLWHVDPLKRN